MVVVLALVLEYTVIYTVIYSSTNANTTTIYQHYYSILILVQNLKRNVWDYHQLILWKTMKKSEFLSTDNVMTVTWPPNFHSTFAKSYVLT